MQSSITVGIIQSGPVYLDLKKSLEKLTTLVSEAAQKGAELIVVGESWLSGYPVWLDYSPNMGLWDYEPTKKVYAQMWQNSVEVPSKTTDYLCHLAQTHQAVLVIGINEKITKGKGNGTLYNGLLTISSEGKIINHRRKLMPTHTERLVHGIGDGYDLAAVDTKIGRISGAICWEHWMPLTRQTLHDSGEHIHIAVWPKVHEMHQICSRQYAFEGRCFVISVGQMMYVRDIPAILDLPDDLKNQPDIALLNGGSCIVAPNGQYELKPQFDMDGVIIYTIDNMERIYEERLSLDVTGHYQRKDVFDLKVTKTR